jgi:hypothetical protein
MKVKEYVLKYDLTKSKKVNHRELVIDLTADFHSLLEVGDGRKNFKGFNNATHAIESKFDAINNYAVTDFSKLWKYFFATVIAPLKEELFPVQMQEIRDRRAKREKMYKDFSAFW